MGTPAFTPLAHYTVGTAQAVVTFSNISQNFRDLVCVVNGASTSGSNVIYLIINSDFGASYNEVIMTGNGSTTASTANSNATANTIWDFDTNQSNIILNFMDYSTTNKHKSTLIRSNNASLGTRAYADRWASNAAINSIRLGTSASTFATGTTFSLYGVLA